MTGPIRVEVAADGRGVLVAGDDRWTFDFDLESGTAVLATGATGGGPVRVRPMRWREKLALANFAGLGDAFRARAVATACASARPPLGPDDASVAALAAWLEGPGAEAAIGGSDPGGLAAVTVDLCRLAGLRPSDLDDLPAGEVAQLWLAARGAAGDDVMDTRGRPDAALDAWSEGATRIVVIDDPATASVGRPADGGARERALDGEPSSTVGEGVTPEALPAAPRAAADRATPVGDAGPARMAPADGPTRPARPAFERAPAVALRRATSDPPTFVGGPGAPASEPAPPTAASRATRADFEADSSPAPGDVASAGVAEPAAVPRSAAWHGSPLAPVDRQGRHAGAGPGRAESSSRVPASVASGLGAPPTGSGLAMRPTTRPPSLGRARPAMRALAAMTDPGLPASRSFRPDATTQVGAPNTQAGVSSPATGRLGAVPVRDPLPAWANAVPDPDRGDDPGPPLLDRSDREALFQAFADELELAAAELGIGSEA